MVLLNVSSKDYLRIVRRHVSSRKEDSLHSNSHRTSVASSRIKKMQFDDFSLTSLTSSISELHHELNTKASNPVSGASNKFDDKPPRRIREGEDNDNSSQLGAATSLSALFVGENWQKQVRFE